MKIKILRSFLFSLISLILVSSQTASAQSQTTREIISRAMKDELARNMERLSLENLERPFFISYTVGDAKTMEVTANLGAIISSNENHFRNHSVRVMVGDYSRTDENFRDMGGGGFRSTMLGGATRLPLEDDYDGIRRALWIATDNVYKRASEQYERKIASLNQQVLSEEAAALDDFSRAPVVKYTAPASVFEMNREEWEKAAKELSDALQDYPEIYFSQVRIYFYQGDIFFVNSEGTEVVQPLTLGVVQVNASTQAIDGEPLIDHVIYHASEPGDLPSLSSMKQAVNNMAGELAALRTAPVFDESYTGPVLFESQAVAEFFGQRLFSGNSGLLASRRPAVSDPRAAYFVRQGQPLDEKINRRIISRDLTIKALPKMKSYSGQKLIGSCEVDAEGVKPPEEIVLVENGILRTLLNNRIPTLKVKESNGHLRPTMGSGAGVFNRLGPSVVMVTTSAGKTDAEMKKTLLQLAREEGLDYGIMVRKLTASISGAEARLDPMAMMALASGGRQGISLSNPILVYRVAVEDGREELVRSVNLGNLSISALRHIAGVAKRQFVHNTLVPGATSGPGFYPFSRRGVPASFIVPESLIFEELEVQNAKRDYTPKLPVVANPLMQD